jgi:NAD(P)-dependent dehydrogenase (short-subunit alcohol dehydrogenase family)
MDGKVAIVTGGGRGIGREECLLLAREGARVVVNDFGGALDGSGAAQGPADEVAKLIREAGGEAIASYQDVSDFDGAGQLIDCALESFGRLDALVNNAGILRDRTLANMSEEEFDAVIAVHLKGHFSCAHWAAAHWRAESKAGNESPRHIVNTTSAAGLIGNRGQTNYGAAKAGIANMTLIWAQELERIGVTVNAVAPIARTRITEATFGAMEAEEDEFDAMDPANVAPLAVFLASDLVGETSGQVFAIHGGALERFEPWTPAESIDLERRWTLEELRDRIGELL